MKKMVTRYMTKSHAISYRRALLCAFLSSQCASLLSLICSRWSMSWLIATLSASFSLARTPSSSHVSTSSERERIASSIFPRRRSVILLATASNRRMILPTTLRFATRPMNVPTKHHAQSTMMMSTALPSSDVGDSSVRPFGSPQRTDMR